MVGQWRGILDQLTLYNKAGWSLYLPDNLSVSPAAYRGPSYLRIVQGANTEVIRQRQALASLMQECRLGPICHAIVLPLPRALGDGTIVLKEKFHTSLMANAKAHQRVGLWSERGPQI